MLQHGRERRRMKPRFYLCSGLSVTAPEAVSPASRGPCQSLNGCWRLRSDTGFLSSVSPIAQALQGECTPFLKYRISRVKHGQPVSAESLSFIIWFSICRAVSSSREKSLISFLMCSWKCVWGAGWGGVWVWEGDRVESLLSRRPNYHVLSLPNNSIFPLLLNLLKILSCSSSLFI